jgi:2-hydroxychromene-2-carboxylate isomerase
MAQDIWFHFDFSSPYGYLATMRIDDLARRDVAQDHWITDVRS